ncbi:RING finger domain-containing protein [Endozoicomonas sp. 4G]|uniref:RING finger domain-containing protein n=1 Tax=Endozoicomonas sp. 4G TaxID=2872754 RepID=UPI002078592A|nr:RING finger domain-containing protein [Endozoicomonas sp. 4G]
MAFLYFYRKDIQRGLSWRLLTNKKTMVDIFVLSLLAIMVVPLCYSSALVDRHHPDGRKFRIEINDERTRNSTLALTGGKPAGNADYPGVGNGGFFYLPPPPWGGTGSGLFEIDLTILQPVINWLISIGKDSGDGRQAANEDGQPSGSDPNAGSNDATNHHQQEKREAPEDQENKSPGEANGSSGDGNNRKDDNGEKSQNNASTQDLQVLANELLAIIASDDPNAAVKFRKMLDQLDMLQRLQVLETKGTNITGCRVTPLEAILALPRSYEPSTRNRFIKQLIAAAGNSYPMIWSDNNHLMILYKIVLDIIHKVNESQQQPPIGRFEKRCFTEYFIQLFLLDSHPVKRIRNLLEEISDLAIRNEIINDTKSLKFSSSFLDILTQSNQHPSFHELLCLSNELRMQNDYIAITSFRDNALRVDKQEPSQIIGAECPICRELFVHSSNIVKAPCNHLYHVNCLNQWLKKRRQNRAIQDCPTCRTQLNGLRINLNDFDELLRKYDGCHSLTTAERAVKEWNKTETSYEALYHFVQFCQHSSLPSDDSQFVKLLRRIPHLVTKAEIIHHGRIHSAVFSTNNHRVVTASDDGTVKIHSDETDGSWREEFTFHHDGPVKLASFSADSRRVLTASDDGIAKIHALKEDGSWQEEMTISHVDSIHIADFSADSRRVLTVSDNGSAKVHGQKEDGSWKEEVIISHDGSIVLASFSADGNHVVTVDIDDLMKITGTSADGSWQVKFIVIHQGWVHSAIFSPNNRYLVTASDDGTTKIIGQKDDGSWQEEYINTDSPIFSAEFSPDSRHVLGVCEDDYLVKIIGKRADGSWGVKAIISHSGFIDTADFSPDSRHVITGSYDHQAKIYGEKTDALWEEEIIIHHDDLIFTAIFSPDSQHAVTASDDGTAKIHNLKNDGSWEEGRTIHDIRQPSYDRFSADGRFMMTFGGSIAQIIDLNSKIQIAIHHPCSITSASFSANSRFVLTLSGLPASDGKGGMVKITELWKEE